MGTGCRWDGAFWGQGGAGELGSAVTAGALHVCTLHLHQSALEKRRPPPTRDLGVSILLRTPSRLFSAFARGLQSSGWAAEGTPPQLLGPGLAPSSGMWLLFVLGNCFLKNRGVNRICVNQIPFSR